MNGADNTARKQQIGIPFKPGESGNPAGRPVGARNRLGEAFLEALESDFKAHGKEALIACRTEAPETYIKVIAGLLPKEIKAEVSHRLASELTDDVLADIATGSSDGATSQANGSALSH